jgi:hypothetical protein
VVALSQQIHVFTFPSPAQRLFTIETRENVLGLCEVSPLQTAERQLLMFPGHKLGSVQLVVRFCVILQFVIMVLILCGTVFCVSFFPQVCIAVVCKLSYWIIHCTEGIFIPFLRIQCPDFHH